MSSLTCAFKRYQSSAVRKTSNILVLALLGVLALSSQGVSAFDHEDLRRLEATHHKAPTNEIKIQAVSQKNAQSKGIINFSLVKSKAETFKQQKEANEIVLLSTLIAVFGVVFIAVTAMISAYVYRVQQQETKEQGKQESAIQMKNIKTAGKALIVSKLNKLQKGSSEEGSKLIKNPMSNRPSDLTAATNDDIDTSKLSSPGMKNLDDPFTVKKFKCNVNDDEEKNKSSPSKSINSSVASASSTQSVTGPKMMRVNTGRNLVKYDRKEVKQPSTPARTPTTKVAPGKKGWK